MPTLLKIENYPDINTKDNAQLAAAADAADTTLVVDGAPNIDDGDFIYVGRVGQQSLDPAEKRQVADATGNPSFVIDALVYDHPQYSPVKAVYGDQIQVYRAANVSGLTPADGSFSTLGAPVDIEGSQVDTEFIDDTGSNLFWYKWVYWNSDTGLAVTDLSDVDAVRGHEFGNYTTIAAIRKEAGITNNPYLSDQYVREQRREAESVLNSMLSGLYTVPLDAPVSPLIERATKLLAAGYILKREFGQGSVNTVDKGQAKIDEVLGTKDKPGMLAGILNGSTEILDGSGGALINNQHVTGWPNSTTADTPVEEGGSRRKFRMGRRY